MKTLFKTVEKQIAEGHFNALEELNVEKPTHFNWVTTVFEGIHLTETPDKTALLWTDGDKTEYYTFKTLYHRYNQLLNFLRQKGLSSKM